MSDTPKLPRPYDEAEVTSHPTIAVLATVHAEVVRQSCGD
ncbi:hypothetical protein H6CHR_05577 [Variovorax sp. PBL-H6]|nr:hypothetical protein H6CHR_05577 [Variovorax sp. PBL-H6]